MKRILVLALAFGAFLLASQTFAATQSICFNSGVPSGWIKIDFYTNYATCGNGGGGATINNNVWVIESYYDKAVGSSMAVCALEPLPAGWQVLYYQTSGYCRYTTTSTNNVKVIRRVS